MGQRTRALQPPLQRVTHAACAAIIRGVVRDSNSAGSRGVGIQLAERPVKRRRGDYPWDRWQAGGWHVVRQGRDFDCTIEGMRSTLFTRAKRDDIAIEVIRNPQAPEIPASRSRLHLAFCFYPGRSYEQGPATT